MGFSGEAGSSAQVFPREDTPLIGQPPPLSSQFKTIANVFIAIVGSGVLGLPYTFSKTGWLLGALTIFAVAALTYHCMTLLVATRRKLESANSSPKIGSFGDLGFAVSGSLGRFAVDAMIVLSQAGFCVAYIIFVAQTLAFLLNSASSTILGMSPKSFYIWCCFPFQLGLNSIPTLTHLAPLSIFADVVDIAAMAVVMVEDVGIFSRRRPDGIVAWVGGAPTFFYGLGVAVYSFEGMGMVLPLQSEARNKDRFSRALALSMAFISTIYAGFGVLGHLAFGDSTRDIITTNLGKGAVSAAVQVGLCINLFLTFPLMMNPVYEVVERRFGEGGGWGRQLLMRWVVVLGVTLVALLVPNFGDFLALVGSSVCSLLGFVLPAWFHWLAFRDERMGWRGVLSDGTVGVLGVVIAVSGTWTSLSRMLHGRTA